MYCHILRFKNVAASFTNKFHLSLLFLSFSFRILNTDICHIYDLSVIILFFFQKFLNMLIFFFGWRYFHDSSFRQILHNFVIKLHIYMPLYTTIYTACCMFPIIRRHSDRTGENQWMRKEDIQSLKTIWTGESGNDYKYLKQVNT